MNKEVKEKWLEALRSGEYKQGRGALRNKDDEYCCLGVLCDVVKGSDGVQMSWADDGNLWTLGSFIGYPPPRVMYLADLNSGQVLQLITRNDDWGNTFEEIADYIEENF